jgi:hypothetical protein
MSVNGTVKYVSKNENARHYSQPIFEGLEDGEGDSVVPRRDHLLHRSSTTQIIYYTDHLIATDTVTPYNR